MGRIMPSFTRTYAVVFALGVTSVLAACGHPAPPVPIPTSGGAWGDQVVPFDTTIALTVTRTDGAQPALIEPGSRVPAAPGEVLAFDAVLAVGPNPRPDFHLFLAAPPSALTIEPKKLTSAGQDRDISPGELKALGMPMGDVAGGTEMRMSFEVIVPDNPSCNRLTPVFTWGGYDGTGDRHWEYFTLTIDAPSCRTPSATTSPAP